jgi:hypothetical protein
MWQLRDYVFYPSRAEHCRPQFSKSAHNPLIWKMGGPVKPARAGQYSLASNESM